MPNPYFDNFSYTEEQDLVEDMVNEALLMYAHEINYLPRNIVSKNEIYGEDSLSTYTTAIPFDVYIVSVSNYTGDSTFLSKFNLEIRDEITFTVTRRLFAEHVTTPFTALIRPREGDLIYSSMMKRMFVIKYVNNTATFYQLGKLYTWDVVCEVWEYSNERFDTGVPEIDALEEDYSVDHVYANTAYEAAMLDVFATNQEFNEKNNAEDIVQWDTLDPFSMNG